MVATSKRDKGLYKAVASRREIGDEIRDKIRWLPWVSLIETHTYVSQLEMRILQCTQFRRFALSLGVLSQQFIFLLVGQLYKNSNVAISRDGDS